MPTWGLTVEMRLARPWGLPPDLLEPAKVQTDPVHSDIYWMEIERKIIDSAPFQRLRHVKQLGMTLKIFPGAEHSRFTHSLGTMRAAQDILDKTLENRLGPNRVANLFDEWQRQPSFRIDGRRVRAFDLKLAEATVLMRLSALIHDLTHVPFGHTIEDDLSVLEPHDRNLPRFQKLWENLDTDVVDAIQGAASNAPRDGRRDKLFDELRAVVLDKVSKETHDEEEAPWVGGKSLYPFVGDIVNNTICADLIDYLRRDHLHSGLPLAVGDRFMNSFYVVPSNRPTEPERLVVRTMTGGETRVDIITELLKYLRYRYEITERALYHKTKLAYDAMLGKFFEMWRDELWFRRATSQERYPRLAHKRKSLDASWLREQLRSANETVVTEIDDEVRDEIELYMRSFGDEGLIEHLLWELEHRTKPNDREKGLATILQSLRNRSHFKMLGHFGGSLGLRVAAEKYQAYRTAAKRRELERAAAKWADIDPAWQLVLWVPPPKMRLKEAEVLIDDHDVIGPLAAAEPDANQIVERHKRLWAIRVYVQAAYRDGPYSAQGERALSYLATELDVPLIRTADGVVVKPRHSLVADDVGRRFKMSASDAAELASMSRESPPRTYERDVDDATAKVFLLAARRAILPSQPDIDEAEIAQQLREHQAAASGDNSFDDLVEQARLLVEEA